MRRRIAAAAVVLAALTGLPTTTPAQDKVVRIGVIYDFTGPFAAGGSEAAAVGIRIAIDMVNERGGVEGYRIEPVWADAQSKAEVAIAEAERLLTRENVALIMGVYSSAHCVPMAQKVDAMQKFMWANVCVSSAVFKGKNLKYVFRPQVHSDQYGLSSCAFLKRWRRRSSASRRRT
jgi:branched-chain amino acid transport system substrate-binding protein